MSPHSMIVLQRKKNERSICKVVSEVVTTDSKVSEDAVVKALLKDCIYQQSSMQTL